MILGLLTFVSGMWLFQFQPRIPDAGLFGVYLLLALCALRLRWLRLPLWLVAGFAWAHGHALLTRPAELPPLDLARPVWVSGTVASLVDRDAGRSRFVLAADRVGQDGITHHGAWRLRVSWYRDAPALTPGERWRLQLRLRPAAGYANPGGFDYGRWLYQQGITHTASVRARADNRRLSAASGYHLTRARAHLSLAIAAQDTGAAGALLRALVIGDRNGFDAAHWQVFRATGASHLVAISGLHVGLVAALVAGAVGFGWRRIPALCARVPALHAGLLAGAIAALGYAALAGFAIPTQRAMLMLAVAALAWLGGRGRRPGLVLAIALALVAAWSPLALLDPGLWLSFAAVAAILWVMAPGKGGGRLRRWVGLQLGLGVALLPLLLLFFGQASLVSPLVNLVAIPWFSLLLVPSALLATLSWVVWPAAGELLWQAWLWLGEVSFALLAKVAAWDGALATRPLAHAGLLPLAGVGVVLMLAPRGLPLRWLGLLLLLPLLTRAPAGPDAGDLTATLLDVGQGLAVVLRDADHVLVYDAGPRFRSGFDTGTAVVLPYLRTQGVAAIDTLVASHGDSDHAGGIAALRRALPVGRVLAGEPGELPGATPCAAGQRWSWGEVRFDVLWPPAGHGEQGNNSSCVLHVRHPGGSLLLTGDIEARVEAQLLATHDLSPTSVVLVPHHGSLSSSTPAFVTRLDPDHVLYAAGRDNRWGFPRPEVVARWRTQGATSWDTARDGAVTVRFHGDGRPPAVGSYRRHRYWQP